MNTINLSLKNLNILPKRMFIVTFSFVLFLSCSKDDDMDEMNQENSNSIKVEAIDKVFFDQIKKASDEIAKNKIWKNYDFATRPMYYIFRNADKKPVRGYLINPSKKLVEQQKLMVMMPKV